MSKPTREIEKILYESGYKCVAGVDEAGRGPLAGPVIAAAVSVPHNFSGFEDKTIVIKDSKKLGKKALAKAYDAILKHPQLKSAWHACNSSRIDEINILQATMEAMTRSVEKLAVRPDYVLVDGNRAPPIKKAKIETVVKGDDKVFAIACASIIAKVTRDRLMVEYDEKWPEYGFAKHKGYGTLKHRNAIEKYGACSIHRMTFKPLKK